MKTLREMMDQLDEISRRDLLKTAGAAAIGGAAGYGINKLANDPSKRWKMNVHNYDALDKEYKGKSFSTLSTDKKMLLVVEPAKNTVALIVNDGPDVLNSFSTLRMKVDNKPAESIDNIRGAIRYFEFNYPADKILNADKILFQVAFLPADEKGRNPMPADYRIITFVPGQQKEGVVEASPEAMANIDRLTRN